ncbi:MAG: 9-O-acetylesterase, partial [Phycisphaerae bacterium]
RLTFKHVGGGLEIGAPPWVTKGEIPPPPLDQPRFSIAGAEHKFVFSQRRIQGNEVVVRTRTVTKPLAVRYGWATYPILNLYNKEKLPASPFRTDKWEP